MLSGNGFNLVIGGCWFFAAVVRVFFSWKAAEGGGHDVPGMVSALACALLGASYLFESRSLAFIVAVVVTGQLLGAVIKKATHTE